MSCGAAPSLVCIRPIRIVLGTELSSKHNTLLPFLFPSASRGCSIRSFCFRFACARLFASRFCLDVGSDTRAKEAHATARPLLPPGIKSEAIECPGSGLKACIICLETDKLGSEVAWTIIYADPWSQFEEAQAPRYIESLWRKESAVHVQAAVVGYRARTPAQPRPGS